MLEHFAETEDAQTANFTSWSCALAADAVDDFSLPITLAERAVEKDHGNVFLLNTLGAVLYRAGRFDEALAKLNEAESRFNDPKYDSKNPPASTWYFLAMTHQRLGHEDEAHKWYDKAAAWTSEVLAPASEDGTAKPSARWYSRLRLELLQREVSEMLETAAEPTNTETASEGNETGLPSEESRVANEDG